MRNRFFKALFICATAVTVLTGSLNAKTLDKTSAGFTFTNLSDLKVSGEGADFKLSGTAFRGIGSYCINENLSAGIAIGNLVTELKNNSYKLKLTDNFYAGLFVRTEIPLFADLKFVNTANYINSAKKDYGISNVNVNDYYVRIFSSDMLIQKKFKPLTAALGVQYNDYRIKSGISSTPDFVYNLRNNNEFTVKAVISANIMKNLSMSLDATDKTISLGASWQFKAVEPKKEQPQKNNTAAEKSKPAQAPVKIEPQQKTVKPGDEQLQQPFGAPVSGSKTAYEQFRDNGTAALKTRRFNDALTNFQNAKNLRPENAEIYRLLAETYEQLGNLEEAIINYDKALSLIRR